jgi:hypothetical protein
MVVRFYILAFINYFFFFISTSRLSALELNCCYYESKNIGLCAFLVEREIVRGGKSPRSDTRDVRIRLL